MKSFSLLIPQLAIAASLISGLLADDYYVLPLGELDFEQDSIAELNNSVTRIARNTVQTVRYPEIRFDHPEVQAYIAVPENENDNRRWWGSENQRELLVAVRLPKQEACAGVVSLATFDMPARVAYPFSFDPGARETATEAEFDKVRKAYYARLASTRSPGGDWFRYRAGDAYKAEPEAARWRNLGQFDSSFNMFTGQRAVSENLALDRELILGTSKDGKDVKVETIKGVTVEAIDWSGRINDAPTRIDPLASVIPHDQHAAFFGSIKEFNQVIRTIEDEGIHYFQNMSNRDSYVGLAKKYQKQMGILIPDILAEQMPVKSLAITGGDPFFPSGTDVCVIFETESPKALLSTLNEMVKAQAKMNGGNMSTEQIGPVAFSYANDDRSFSSYLFSGENFVAVANSPDQALKMTSTLRGDTASLGSLEEFKFFRQRYPLEDEAAAFTFLSDATIRRWAGPEFRIGASRRVRAAAALGQLTARLIDEQELESTYQDLIGKVDVNGKTLRSEIFNTMEFLTPISELKIETVTANEKEAYERWRNGYENGWVRFDPIALSIQMTKDTLGLDLSVIPLRLNSDYDEWIATAGEASLDEQAMTPHSESLLMVSHAIDTSSRNFQMFNTQGSAMLPGIGANPLAWVGGSLTVFADQDPFWDEMEASGDHEEYIEHNLAKLPVGLRISSKSPVKLALFLTTLRSFSEQAAPGLLVWETLEHEETPYVAIRPTNKAGLPDHMDLRIFYAAMPDAFVLSLNEALLKRAITRNLKFEKPDDQTEPKQESPYQVFAQSEVKALQTYLELFGSGLEQERQFTSWSALPILNEWKRLFPDRDPVKVHHDYFKETLHCPGGQGYQWNEALGSMESIAFGHPEAPKSEASPLPLLKNWAEAKAAIGLKNKEFRLEATLEK